jgi:hypothetical protein
VIDGVDHARASADVTSGVLRVRTESTDLDTNVPDGQKAPRVAGDEMILQSPGGNLPNLQEFDRVDLEGFANSANNGRFIVTAVNTHNSSYVHQALARPFRRR